MTEGNATPPNATKGTGRTFRPRKQPVPRELRVQAIADVAAGRKSLRQVGRELGVSFQAVDQWVRRNAEGKPPTDGPGRRVTAPLTVAQEADIRRCIGEQSPADFGIEASDGRWTWQHISTLLEQRIGRHFYRTFCIRMLQSVKGESGDGTGDAVGSSMGSLSAVMGEEDLADIEARVRATQAEMAARAAAQQPGATPAAGTIRNPNRKHHNKISKQERKRRQRNRRRR